jgi:hypothetical protein
MHVFEESVAMVDRLSDLLRAQDHCKTDGKEDKGAGTNYSDTAKTPIPIKSDHYQSYSQTFTETTYVASSDASEDESDLESGFGDLSSSSEEDDREREDMVEKAGSDAFGAAVPQQTPYGRRRHSCPEAIGAQKGSRPSIPMLPLFDLVDSWARGGGGQAGCAVAGASTEDTDVEVNVGYITYFTSTQLLF